MNKHTPGPWSAKFEETRAVRAPDGGMIALMNNLKGQHGTMGRRNPDEVLANQRLVAAAPELFEALKYARRFLKPEDHDTAFVDAAIAKATQS